MLSMRLQAAAMVKASCAWNHAQQAGGFMLHVTRHTSHVTRHTSHVMRHTSLVTRHTSHVTRHTSHVTLHTLNLTMFVGGGRGDASL